MLVRSIMGTRPTSNRRIKQPFTSCKNDHSLHMYRDIGDRIPPDNNRPISIMAMWMLPASRVLPTAVTIAPRVIARFLDILSHIVPAKELEIAAESRSWFHVFKLATNSLVASEIKLTTATSTPWMMWFSNFRKEGAVARNWGMTMTGPMAPVSRPKTKPPIPRKQAITWMFQLRGFIQ